MKNIHGVVIFIGTIDGDIDSDSKLCIFLFEKCVQRVRSLQRNANFDMFQLIDNS